MEQGHGIAPGYFWNHRQGVSFPPVLDYAPISNVYCPPVYHAHVQCNVLWVAPEHQYLMGRVIGKSGFFFKKMTQDTGCIYMYYRKEWGCIEIWGYPPNAQWAMHLLWHHLGKVISQASQSPWRYAPKTVPSPVPVVVEANDNP